MKLTNQQIDALVAQIDERNKSERNAEINAKVDAAEKEIKVAAKKLHAELGKMSTELFDLLNARTYNEKKRGDFTLEYFEEVVRNKHRVEVARTTAVAPSTTEIRNKILVASIDAADLADLSAKLGFKLP